MKSVGIRIEPADERHAPAVQSLASDAMIAATSNVPHPYPKDGALDWVRRASDGRSRTTLFAFAVIHVREGVVGVCSLMSVDLARRASALGYWIGRPYWGRGYATEAARQVLEFGFRELGLVRVEAGALDRNLASIRVLQKLGFVIAEQRTPHEKGRGHVYRLDRSAWLTGTHAASAG